MFPVNVFGVILLLSGLAAYFLDHGPFLKVHKVHA